MKFEYTVAGKSYIGNQAGPDTNGLPGRIDNSAPWRAFYDPDNPGIAVLHPAEFQGTGLLIVAAFPGLWRPSIFVLPSWTIGKKGPKRSEPLALFVTKRLEGLMGGEGIRTQLNSIPRLQHLHEGFLRDVDFADHLHALFAFLPSVCRGACVCG